MVLRQGFSKSPEFGVLSFFLGVRSVQGMSSEFDSGIVCETSPTAGGGFFFKTTTLMFIKLVIITGVTEKINAR